MLSLSDHVDDPRHVIMLGKYSLLHIGLARKRDHDLMITQKGNNIDRSLMIAQLPIYHNNVSPINRSINSSKSAEASVALRSRFGRYPIGQGWAGLI